MKRISFLLVGLVLVTSGSALEAKEACDVALAKQAWAKCSSCHSADVAVRSPLGPNLEGVIGRRAGTLSGFHYSPALKNYAVVWTRKSFEEFISAPQTIVPGTRMAFSGLKSPAERNALSCVLEKGEP